MFYLILVLFVIVGSALTVLTVQNLVTSVQLTLFGLKTPGIAPGLLIFLSFLSGALFLYLVAIISARHDRRRMKRLRQRVKELELGKQPVQPAQPVPMMGMPQMNMQPMNMQPPMNRPSSTIPLSNMPPPMNMPSPNMPPNMQPPMNRPPSNMGQPNMSPHMNMPPNMQPPMNMSPSERPLPMNVAAPSTPPRTSIIKTPGLGPVQR